ncbi:hypothetical protein HK100_009684 [Physocladia obscura]|uniref:Cyclin n=1 Tax=Physocladia obscura TaxID=109957 RepID=A0AAD5T357_9FUNG|nr:hypothetical protein HK100_009684 [Physocladia obscura]
MKVEIPTSLYTLLQQQSLLVSQQNFASSKHVPPIPNILNSESSNIRSGFVDRLVDTSASIIESIWPSKSSTLQTSSKVLPLKFFIQEILRRSKTSFSTLQLALLYIIRARNQLIFVSDLSALSENSLITHQALNHAQSSSAVCPRRMFLSALILASKYLQDRNYSNKAWAKISGLQVLEINANEFEFLALIDYELFVGHEAFSNWTNLLMAKTQQLQIARQLQQIQQPGGSANSLSPSSTFESSCIDVDIQTTFLDLVSAAVVVKSHHQAPASISPGLVDFPSPVSDDAVPTVGSDLSLKRGNSFVDEEDSCVKRSKIVLKKIGHALHMDKPHTAKKQRAVALTQAVRALWASQFSSQSVSPHQSNLSQASTNIAQSSSLIPDKITLARRVILPELSPDPDLQDYPFVPDEARVAELDYNGDEVKSNVPSDDELFKEYYSQTPTPSEMADAVPELKPLIRFDASVKQNKASYYVDEDRRLNIICAPFDSYKRGNESKVSLSKKKIGTACIRFYKEIDGAKISLALREKFESSRLLRKSTLLTIFAGANKFKDVTESASEVKTNRDPRKKSIGFVFCVTCLWDRTNSLISEQNAKEFIIEIGTYNNSPSVKRNLCLDEITYIKTKTHKGHYNKDMERVRNQIKGGFTVVRKTATPMEFVELAKKSGVDE